MIEASGDQLLGQIVATIGGGEKRWYAVVHLLNSEGAHRETWARYAGATSDGEGEVVERAKVWLEERLRALPRWSHGDVIVRLFSVRIDGRRFGLVDASEPSEGYEALVLEPGDLTFFPPYTGEYDT